jgi:hypothetical protein
MSWIYAFFASLFSGWFGRKVADHAVAATAVADAAHHHEAPASEDTLYADAPENTVGQRKQHHWLFDEGVLHWNQHRRDNDFKPDFGGTNFPHDAAKSRLWGCPPDLVGGERVVLSGIDLRYADLKGAVLARADLRHAKLQGADLRDADLSSSNLESADLTDCDLRGAKLDGAVLVRARLVNANLTGASLKNTNFAWADVSHMQASFKGVEQANLFGVVRRDYAADAV